VSPRLLAAALLVLPLVPGRSFPAAGPNGEDMARIPAGEFWMGRTHNFLIDELGMHLRPRLDDQPAHLVYVDAFWIDKYEVTNEAYARFAQATARRKPFHWIGGKIPAGQERFPVANITWDDAAAYC
jgi:formylglycine-generating enzyme required for sulfatase activity